MKANDARKRTREGITKKQAAEDMAEQKRLLSLEEARQQARDGFDEHYAKIMTSVGKAADNGKNSTTWAYMAYLDKDGSHGWRHAFETELAKLAVRKLKLDGYVVTQTTRSERVQANEGQDDQAVCIDLDISW